MALQYVTSVTDNGVVFRGSYEPADWVQHPEERVKRYRRDIELLERYRKTVTDSAERARVDEAIADRHRWIEHQIVENDAPYTGDDDAGGGSGGGSGGGAGGGGTSPQGNGDGSGSGSGSGSGDGSLLGDVPWLWLGAGALALVGVVVMAR